MLQPLRIAALTALMIVGCSIGQSQAIATDKPQTQRAQCSGTRDRKSSTLSVVGLPQDQRLVCFNEHRPNKATNIGTVSGLSGGDTSLIGIDYRVQNGMLYGVGNAGGIYLLNASNAKATCGD